MRIRHRIQSVRLQSLAPADVLFSLEESPNLSNIYHIHRIYTGYKIQITQPGLCSILDNKVSQPSKYIGKLENIFSKNITRGSLMRCQPAFTPDFFPNKIRFVDCVKYCQDIRDVCFSLFCGTFQSVSVARSC